MDELDEGFLPEPAQVGVGIIVIVGIGAFLLLSIFAEPRDPPKPPGPLLGCYSTPGGPDMLFEAAKVTVLQKGYRIEVKQTLEYRKGWAFNLDRGLGWFIAADKRLVIDYRSKFSQFLFLSREGQVASKVPSFQLNALGQLTAIRYSRSGDRCLSVGG